MNAKTRRPMVLLVVGLIASLLGCVVFAGLWIDRSISFSYMELSSNSATKAYQQTRSMLENEWRGISKKDLLEKLQIEGKQNIKVSRDDEENVIWFDQITFEIEADKLKSIK